MCHYAPWPMPRTHRAPHSPHPRRAVCLAAHVPHMPHASHAARTPLPDLARSSHLATVGSHIACAPCPCLACDLHLHLARGSCPVSMPRMQFTPSVGTMHAVLALRPCRACSSRPATSALGLATAPHGRAPQHSSAPLAIALVPHSGLAPHACPATCNPFPTCLLSPNNLKVHAQHPPYTQIELPMQKVHT